MFDLNLIPLYFVDNQELPDQPGVFSTAAPRRAARGRAGELLFCFITFQGRRAPDSGEMQTAYQKMSEAYFKTAGPVTAALRQAAESLNQSLLEQNRKNSGTGQQVSGLLNLAAVHEENLYLAQAGLTHAYLVSPGALEHFTDTPPAEGRGLGLTQAASLRYFHAEPGSGAFLVVCADPPASWNATTLTSPAALSPENLRRRLLGQPMPNLSAMAVQFQPGGKGQIQSLRLVVRGSSRPAPTQTVIVQPTVAPAPAPTPAAEPQPATSEPPAAAEIPMIVEPVVDLPAAEMPAESAAPAAAAADLWFEPEAEFVEGEDFPEEGEGADEAEEMMPAPLPTAPAPSPIPAAPAPAPVPTRQAQTVPAPTTVKPAQTQAQAQTPPRAAVKPAQAAPRPRKTDTARQAASFWLKMRNRLSSLGGWLTLSPFWMITIAIAVPLIIVAITWTVYYQRGLIEQYNFYYSQAQSAAGKTLLDGDPAARRTAWKETILYLEKADSYYKTAESSRLKEQANSELDKLDNVQRLSFKPAITSELATGAVISQMVTQNSNLYLLDATHGSVVRAVKANPYSIDPAFQCGPGMVDNIEVGPLVGIAALPANNKKGAVIMGMDENANLVFCYTGKDMDAESLLAPQNSVIGKVGMFVYENDALYVLDVSKPENTLVWLYANTLTNEEKMKLPPERQNLMYPETPYLLLPPPGTSLKQISYMAVNQQDVYLLQEDGLVARCLVSLIETTPSRCATPVEFVDRRVGYEPKTTVFPGTSFTRVGYVPPPDPSIYLLDSISATLYRFSINSLELQSLYRPQANFNNGVATPDVTAFHMDSNRTLFYAFGNQVYYAYLP